MGDPRAPRAKSIGHYVLMKTIGEGTFGKVKLGTHILTGERVAVKVLEKERIVDIADVERVAREIHILKLIRQCRHIIQLYEIIETPRQLYLIMEYASGGELFDYIVQRGRAEEREACKFLHQILAGVERVHSMNICHRDLKPENLLLDDRNDIKLVDFGLSNTYQDGQLLQTACGSPCYAAPEMIAGHKYVPSMVDIWSCGVILFALVCGFLPFEDANHSELYKKILAAEYEMPDFVSQEVAHLIRGMLTTDPEKRMKLEDIRKHPWYCQIPEASLLDREELGSLDEDILDQLENYGFPRDYATKCLNTNKHNHVTTTYYLIKEKNLRSQAEGRGPMSDAIADIDATCQDAFHGFLAEARATPTPSRGGRAELLLTHGDHRDSARAGAEDVEAMLDAATASRSPRVNLHGPSKPQRPSSAAQQTWTGASLCIPRKSGVATPRGGITARLRPGEQRLSERLERLERLGERDGNGIAPMSARRRNTSSGPRPCSPFGAWGEGPDAGAAPFSARRPPSASASAAGRGRVPFSARGEGPGTVQVLCSPGRSARQIVTEVIRTLGSQGLSFRQVSHFVVRCQAEGVRLQAEVVHLDRGGGLSLRFTRAAGDTWVYKELCSRLLADMNL